MPAVDEIEVRPFSSRQEYELMLDYFYKADDPFLRGMGVDRLKLPERNKWLDALLADHEKPDGEKDRFYLVGYFEDSGLDTQVSITSFLAPRPTYICICGSHN
jgi:hypothetical protein